jgi:hypothetical protein
MAITAKIGPARVSTLVACVHDTALLIAALPGSPIVGMGWSPAARLLLRLAGGAAQAEVRDSECWRPAAEAASGNGRSGGRGLAPARLACDGVGIRAGAGAPR